jgi:hypothetical protein
MRRGPIVIGALAIIAMVATVAAQEPGSDSPRPTLDNQGPRGLGVLATWLREAGVDVRGHDGPLTELPPGIGAVVLASPSAEELRPEEVEALARFVKSGGTLVYLASRTQPQPALNEWLHVQSGPVPPLVTESGLEDVGGTTVDVTFQAGLLSTAKKLRLSAAQTVIVDEKNAVPVTTHRGLWWMPMDQGEVWIGAGPDLAENARLELADNAIFWANLGARGPILFDEFHHHQTGAPLPVNLVVSGLQLAFLAVLFVWARGARLGPPRDPPASPARSTREYVSAMAALTQNANVEAELVVAVRAQFRKTLQEEHGIPLGWSWDEVDAELTRRGGKAGAVKAALTTDSLLETSRALSGLSERSRGHERP